MNTDTNSGQLKRKYIVIDEIPLAEGAFGAVHKAFIRREDGGIDCIAVKVVKNRSIRLEENAAFKLVTDVATFIKYLGDHDPFVHENYISPKKFMDKEMIFMEFAVGGDLFKVNFQLHFLGERLEGDAGRAYAMLVLKVVVLLHHEQLVHRDIKVENFLVRRIPGQPLTFALGDAGFVTDEIFSNDCKVSNIISAPEMQNNESHDLIKADMWSACIVAATPILGRFDLSTAGARMSNGVEYVALQDERVRNDVLCVLPGDSQDLRAAKEFFSRAITVDPRNRRSAQELLNDPYFFGLREDFDLGPVFDDLARRFQVRGGTPFLS